MQETLDFAQIRITLVIEALVYYRLVPDLDWEDENNPHRQAYFTMIEPILPPEPFEGLEGKDPRIALLKILAAARKAKVPGDEATVYKFCAKILKMDPLILMPEILHGMESLQMRCAYIMTHAPFWNQPGSYPQIPIEVAGNITVKQHQYIVPNKHYDYHDAAASDLWTSAGMTACKLIDRVHAYDDSVDHRCQLLLLAGLMQNRILESRLDKAKVFLAHMNKDLYTPYSNFLQSAYHSCIIEHQIKTASDNESKKSKCSIQ